MKINWRWIGFTSGFADEPMDFDRSLFQRVKNLQDPPTLRFYRWNKPTLSFGRTQGLELSTQLEFEAKGWQVVRRPTGGGMVLHDGDICFSLFWRKYDSALPWSVTDSYCAIHQWMKMALDQLGLPAQLCKGDDKANQNGWCFQKPVRHDLLRGGQKIIGGAQWRCGDAALHQGSIQIKNISDLSIFKTNFESIFGIKFIEESYVNPAIY